MALIELPDLAAGIASVRVEDVETVRKGVPSKLAALRPMLGGGRLGAARNLARDVHTLFQLLFDRSFPVPWRTTAAIVFGLGYFLMSVDLIPDVIPVVGFLDDALVMAEIVYLLSGDLQRFRAHQATRTRDEKASARRARRDREQPAAPPVRHAA
ncbi:MAG TPA: DUF1232 domain-containing protein [Polyangiaceae bacterium]|jgi:uncharacterized membrane protein YkvA (DUF1232 family)